VPGVLVCKERSSSLPSTVVSIGRSNPANIIRSHQRLGRNVVAQPGNLYILGNILHGRRSTHHRSIVELIGMTFSQAFLLPFLPEKVSGIVSPTAAQTLHALDPRSASDSSRQVFRVLRLSHGRYSLVASSQDTLVTTCVPRPQSLYHRVLTRYLHPLSATQKSHSANVIVNLPIAPAH
jgi:hypothetical protein